MSNANIESRITWHPSWQQAGRFTVGSLPTFAANDDWRMNSAVAAGAVRDLFVKANALDLASLMRSIELGNSPAASQIAGRILASLSASAEPKPPAKTNGLLSPRELKVLLLISEGQSNRQIAEETHRSINTIEAQLKSIYRKLDVKSRTQAVREATQRGLLN
ncbi:response regulator transcription factor [Variovorax sp. OV700]|jgi:DNA-binding NarL/FixJ family response regulator|uniref:helix-turn-helix transcriptional regulator n=1 Tax=Variovorax sp. OV700 TaxID=1882826 RepID=UPI00088B2626|nr:response regulator transcription factor [Variovorax sp. OV700]SDH43042.1 regulatory protein, luxR family [Variovorax sp. OV700]